MMGKDQEDRQQWSIARWMAYRQMCLSPYIKSHQKPSSPVKFYRFPWEQDQEHESSGISKEQENELINIIRNFKSRNNV